MDFGEVGLAGAFLKPEQFATERSFPMRLHFCADCYAVQVTDRIPADIMFQNYFYFSSSIGTLRDHFREYAAEVTKRFLDPAKATVLEFGCNDGVLLRPLADQGIRTVIGVDPASNVVATIDDPRVKVVNDYFTEDVAREVVARHGKVDLIMANNVYAHIPDIQGTTRAVAEALHRDGVFAFEVHYLGKVIDETAIRHDLSRASLLLLAAVGDESSRPLRHDGVRHQADADPRRLDAFLCVQEGQQARRIGFAGSQGARGGGAGAGFRPLRDVPQVLQCGRRSPRPD